MLEDNLGRKLHVERLARPETGSAVEVSNCISHHAACAGSARRAATSHRARARGEIDPIEHIEHLRAELNSEALLDGNVLEHGQVNVCESGTIESIAREISVGIRRAWAAGRTRHAEGGGVHPLLAAQTPLERVADSGKRIRNDVQPGTLCSRVEVKRLPAMQRDLTRCLPAARQQFEMGRTRNVPSEKRSKVVPGIEIAAGVFLRQVEAI